MPIRILTKLNLRVRADNDQAPAPKRRRGFVEEGRLSRELLINGIYHDPLWLGGSVEA